MKKSLFIVIILLVNSAFLVAQTSPASFQWERSQNGIAGSFNTYLMSKNDQSGNNYVLAYSDEDMLVVKFNSVGQVDKTYKYNNAGNADDYPKDFSIDGSGNVYMAGYSFIGSQYNMTVVKYDNAGNLLWEFNYLPYYWVYPTQVAANAMCVDGSNNVYFTGTMNDSLIAVKLNSNGIIQWATKISVAGNYLGSGKDIAVDGFGSVYLCGTTKNTSGDFDGVTAKLNSSGVVQWTRQVAGFASVDDASLNLGIDNSSNVYVSSEIADTSSTNFTTYLTKYNASGAQQWQKKLYVNGQINSHSVKLCVDGVGNTYFGQHSQSATGVGYSTVYKHNSSGSQLYATVLDDPTENDNSLTDIYLDPSTNIYAAGNLTSPKAFYAKINLSGGIMFNNAFSQGTYGIFSPVGILAEQSGSFNLLTDANNMLFNERLNATAQFQFESFYKGASNTYDGAVKILAQSANSVYALGYVTNDVSGIDAVLSKYDAQGNLQWQNIIDNNLANDAPFDMAKDSIYNIYLSKTVNYGNEVVKFDSIGSPIWSYPSNEKYKKVIVANGGEVFLAGDEISNSSSFQSFHVAKLDNNGVPVYISTAPATDPDYYIYTDAMALDSNYKIAVAGHRTYHFGQPDHKIAVVLEKYSTTGTMLWHRELPIPDSTSQYAQYYVNASKVLTDGNNNIYVMGSAYKDTAFGVSYTYLAKYNGSGVLQYMNLYNGNGNWYESGGEMRFFSNQKIAMFSAAQGNFVVRKIEPSDGSIIWETPVYEGYSNSASSVRVDGNDNVFFVGSAIVGNSVRDIVLGKLNASGVQKWVTSKAGDAVGNDWANSMDITNSGRIYVAASMLNSSGSMSDFAVLKFCDINTPILTIDGQTQDICTGSTVTLSATFGSGNSYLWNDGATSSDTLVANATGDYYCSVIKYDGCSKNTDTVHVQLKSPPSTPQICLVTVDSASTHNIIVWDKTGVTGATAFNVYREDVTNVYSYIATVPYDSLSEYHDYGANPNVTTKRYKISAIDTCGQESEMSNYHNTIYIAAGTNGQFSWYPGYTIENSTNPVDNYLLMRDDNSDGNWAQIGSTAGNQNTVNDPAYASYPNASYRVETAWSIGCTPTRGAINTSRSNVKSPSSIGIKEINSNDDFMVSPNPATDQVTVSMRSFDENMVVKVYNTLGQEIITEKITSNTTVIDLTRFAAGTYFIRVEGREHSTMKKLLKY